MEPTKWWSTLNTRTSLVERQTLWASRAHGSEYVRIFTSFGRDKLCGLHVLMGDKLYSLVGENKCPTQGERIGAAPDAALLPRLPRGGLIEEQLV